MLDFFLALQIALADAPPLADAQRLPPPAMIDAARDFNREFRWAMESRWQVERAQAETFRRAIIEAERLDEAWALMDRARAEGWYTAAERRFFLRDLRRLIGPANYYAGRWPPCVPIWRFESADP